MVDVVEIDKEGLLVWGYDEEIVLECYEHGLSLEEYLGNLYELKTFLKLLNDPECVTHDEIYDLLCSQVKEAFLSHISDWINQFNECLEISPKTEIFLNWQQYLKKLIHYKCKNTLITEKEAFELAELLIVRQYSYKPNIPLSEFNFTGNKVHGFSEMQCETYRIDPLDDKKSVGYNKYYIYLNLNNTQWLYSYGKSLSEERFIEKYRSI